MSHGWVRGVVGEAEEGQYLHLGDTGGGGVGRVKRFAGDNSIQIMVQTEPEEEEVD